ncbi:MAG: ABC transporter permease, partial [Actinomycetota bacterium]
MSSSPSGSRDDDATSDAPKRGTPTPLLVIVPGSTPLRQYGRDLWHHRDLIRVLGRRDLTLRYRQTLLGAVWVVLQPILAAGLLSFVFGRIADLPTEGVPTFLFTYSGMLAWSAFSATLNRAATTLIGSASLVAKIFFPRLVLPLASVASVAVDFAVTFMILLVMMVARGVPPGPEVLLLPVWLLFLLAMAQGTGAFIGSFAVRYRDFANITPFLLQLGLYASPVAYSVSAVPERYQSLYYLNPVVSLLEAFRWSLFGTTFPTLVHFSYSVIVSLLLLVIGF